VCLLEWHAALPGAQAAPEIIHAADPGTTAQERLEGLPISPACGLGQAVLGGLKLACQERRPVPGTAGRELVDQHDVPKTRQGFGKALVPKGIFQRQRHKGRAGEPPGQVPKPGLELYRALPRIGELPFWGDPQGRLWLSGNRLSNPEQGGGSLACARGQPEKA